MNSYAKIAIAAVAVIAIGAVGLAVMRPSQPGPGVEASLSPSTTAQPAPSEVTDSPAPAGVQLWAGARRVEPSGDPTIVAMEVGLSGSGLYSDATGDGKPGPVDLVDIVSIQVDWSCYNVAMCVDFDIAAEAESPLRDPTKDFVAYGLMVDTDGDGIGDVFAGIDNGFDGPRAWMTDLHSGETVAHGGMWITDTHISGRTVLRNISLDGYVPWLVEPVARPLRGWVGVDESVADPLNHFYLWAAVIREGRVVSVDFVPDVGWLDGYQR